MRIMLIKDDNMIPLYIAQIKIFTINSPDQQSLRNTLDDHLKTLGTFISTINGIDFPTDYCQ